MESERLCVIDSAYTGSPDCGCMSDTGLCLYQHNSAHHSLQDSKFLSIRRESYLPKSFSEETMEVSGT